MTASSGATSATRAPASAPADSWIAVCPTQSLRAEEGVAALVGAAQLALFRTFDGALYAVDNRDPFSGACVLSRGIVGNRGDVPTVSSPLHKQVFDLRTGRCLDEPAVALRTYPVRVRDGLVQVKCG